MNEKLESAAKNYEQMAGELELASRHFKTAAQHMREAEVPRASAQESFEDARRAIPILKRCATKKEPGTFI